MSTTTEIFKEGVSAIGKALGLAPTPDHLSQETEEANSAAAMPQHAIAMLTLQHREVDQLFAEIENAGEQAIKTKEKLLEILLRKIQVHTDLEEAIFYPAAKRADKELVLEALEEHDNVKLMLKKMAQLHPTDEHFSARVTVLKELIHHHVREEEGHLFPKCEATLGESALEDLGREMVQKMKRLEHRPLHQPLRKAAKPVTHRTKAKAAAANAKTKAAAPKIKVKVKAKRKVAASPAHKVASRTKHRSGRPSATRH